MSNPTFDTTKIEVIQGPEGPCLSINDYRVCGPKPWGGGTVIVSWTVRMSVRELLKELDHAN